MNEAKVEIPAHVPEHLVYDYDFFKTPTLFETPQQGVAEKLQREAPRIFFTPRNGGHWVVSRVADIVEMFRHPELFPNDPQYNWFRRQNQMRFMPQGYDPPEHAEARRIFAPLFVPGAVLQLEPMVRALARELIDDVVDNGSCEFVRDIAERFPVTVFLKLADGPLEHRESMVEMSKRFFRAPDPEVMRSGMRDLAAFLGGLIDERRRKPGDDLLSRIVTAQFQGRPLTEQEAVGAAVFVFLAGLDTVTAMMSFVMKFLARNSEHYQLLANDPARIGDAIEELMRVSGVAMPERGVKNDIVFRDVQFKQFDRILVLLMISGMDPEAVDEPSRVDFERDISPHLVFGSGAHRCLGSHLARVEIRVFLEEWVAKIAKFWIPEDTIVKVNGGTVWLPQELPLIWEKRA